MATQKQLVEECKRELAKRRQELQHQEAGFEYSPSGLKKSKLAYEKQARKCAKLERGPADSYERAKELIDQGEEYMRNLWTVSPRDSAGAYAEAKDMVRQGEAMRKRLAQKRNRKSK